MLSSELLNEAHCDSAGKTGASGGEKRLGTVKLIHLLMWTDHENIPCFGIDPLYLLIPINKQKGQKTNEKSKLSLQMHHTFTNIIPDYFSIG